MARKALFIDFESTIAKEFAAINVVLESLKGTGLEHWLGCGEFFNEKVVTHFLTNSVVTEGNILYTLDDTRYMLDEELFARTFKLPNSDEGYRVLSAEDLTRIKVLFSVTNSPVPSHGSRNFLKPHF